MLEEGHFPGVQNVDNQLKLVIEELAKKRKKFVLGTVGRRTGDNFGADTLNAKHCVHFHTLELGFKVTNSQCRLLYCRLKLEVANQLFDSERGNLLVPILSDQLTYSVPSSSSSPQNEEECSPPFKTFMNAAPTLTTDTSS